MFRALEGRPVSQGPFLGEGRGVCRTDGNRPHKNERSGWACSTDPPLLPPSSCLFHGRLSSLFRNIYSCLLPWQALKHRDEQGPRGPALFGLGNPGGHFLNSAAAALSRGLVSVFLPASLAASRHSVPVFVWQEHLRAFEFLGRSSTHFEQCSVPGREAFLGSQR